MKKTQTKYVVRLHKRPRKKDAPKETTGPSGKNTEELSILFDDEAVEKAPVIYAPESLGAGGLVAETPMSPGFMLHLLSKQLDEKIRDAEDYLIGLELGVEATVPVLESEDYKPEPEATLAFRRLKEGWKLMYGFQPDPYELRYVEHELTKVSRQRKVAALMQLPRLAREVAEHGEATQRQVMAAINIVDWVIKGQPT